ncbi:hypothetical protein [Spirillospora sp. NPDC047279]|uniref:hypothetical protein n=1 Tax=Spirillospora sp. NPDC047279 TaxID=3155478 RepID=UPI0033CE983A
MTSHRLAPTSLARSDFTRLLRTPRPTLSRRTTRRMMNVGPSPHARLPTGTRPVVRTLLILRTRLTSSGREPVPA